MLTQKFIGKVLELQQAISATLVDGADMDTYYKFFDDLEEALECMSEEEYGHPFMHNLREFVMGSERYEEINDAIVNNTVLELALTLCSLIGRDRDDVAKLARMQKREALSPFGQWCFRSHFMKVRRNKHSYMIYLHCEKDTSKRELKSQLNRLLEMMKK